MIIVNMHNFTVIHLETMNIIGGVAITQARSIDQVVVVNGSV